MDNQILQQLYLAYGRELRLYLNSLCANPSMAEDLLQETFIKAILSMPGQHPNMRAWLYTVARNLCFTAMRRERKVVPSRETERLLEEVGKGEAGQGIVEDMIRRERNKSLYSAMEQLSPQKREILQLQYFGGMPLKECAHLMGISAENARVLSHRARRELKAILKEADYDIS